MCRSGAKLDTPEEHHQVVADALVIEHGVQLGGGHFVLPAQLTQTLHEVVVEILDGELRHPEPDHLLLARLHPGPHPRQLLRGPEQLLEQPETHGAEETVSVRADPAEVRVLVLELEDLGAEHLVRLELRLQLVQGQHARHQTRARGNVLLYGFLLLQN